jgi:hypothetical protein
VPTSSMESRRASLARAKDSELSRPSAVFEGRMALQERAEESFSGSSSSANAALARYLILRR